MSTFGKKRKAWNDIVLRYCVIWHSQSPRGYRLVRKLNLFSLPAPSTLRAYIGYSCGDLSLTSLIEQRLFQESKRLNPLQKFGSLILDEMPIK
ncbi:hypothetical protein X975_24851, partial [Stegodyphus mimosarum]